MVYVSQTRGQDTDSCGRYTSPCQSLQHGAGKAPACSTVKLDGNGGTATLYPLCSESQPAAIKQLYLMGYNGKPKVGCESPEKRSNVSILNDDSQSPCAFQACNLEISNCDMSFANCSVHIEKSTFTNASLRTMKSCAKADVTILESTWYGSAECKDTESCLTIDRETHQNRIGECDDVNLHVSNSHFYQSGITVTGSGKTNIQIVNSHFTNHPDKVSFLGGLLLTFPCHEATVSITGSRFENQNHPTKIQSLLNLYEAAVRVRSLCGRGKLGNASVIIQNCQFVNNERGLTFIGHYQEAYVEHSEFRDNVAMHAGAAILQLSHNATHTKINNCSFVNNKAGTFRNNYPVKESEKEFMEVNTEMGQAAEVNTTCCKGSITLVGKGGAIRFQRGDATISDSEFINNTATLQGGSLFVERESMLHILNTNFENTDVNDHSEEGDIVYSDGDMRIHKARFNVRTARDNLLVLYHSGHHWSIDMTHFFFQCPPGFNFHGKNTSAYGVTDYGLRRSYKLDKVSYYCKPCPVNQYSLDHGYLNYTLVHNSFAYFALFINGSRPHPQYTGDYIHHKIQCKDCPKGKRCAQGSISAASSWRNFPYTLAFTLVFFTLTEFFFVKILVLLTVAT